MARRNKFKVPGVSFSWKRALGVTKAKQSFARKTGIPTTKTGRRNKMRRMMTGGCLTYIIMALMIMTAIILILL